MAGREETYLTKDLFYGLNDQIFLGIEYMRKIWDNLWKMFKKALIRWIYLFFVFC